MNRVIDSYGIIPSNSKTSAPLGRSEMRRVTAAIGVVLGLVVSCGGDPSGSTSNNSGDIDDSSVATGAITNKQDVSQAVVQITTEGSYRDPEFGQSDAAGSGSGFIISSDGLVVTNQHVVDGAASIEVYVQGKDRPVNARILGVSECNDLAVLDLEGDGYPFLAWYEGAPEPGLDAWAAGFPLSDPEYSLTRGSIVKARANGETEWASIDYAIEHDANIQPGNSGGPLVTEDGRVIGVNYAVGDLGGTGTSQFFAISAELAQEVVETLKNGQDQDSIGINGYAIAYEGLAGLWVSGVRAGSPASDLGILAGDIVLDLAGLELVKEDDVETFGFPTKSGYCDVLRTQGSDAAIEIRVLRYDTGEILVGELNNPDRPLVVEDSIAGSITGLSTGVSTYQYQLVVDDSEALQVEVPVDWTERDSTLWSFFDGEYPRIDASENLDDYLGTWGTSGLTVIAAPGLDDNNFDATLEYFTKEFYVDADCEYLESDEYDNGDDEYPVYGMYDVYQNCGGDGGAWFVVGVFYDQYYDVLIIVAAQAVTDADLEVIDRALATFYMP
jgi:serine protease Do